MPLHPPHAAQALRSSAIAFDGDGAPSRGFSSRSPAAARRTFTLHRATSCCVCRPVARIDAKASRTAGASARSDGKVRTFADVSGMRLTRRFDSVRNGRLGVNTLLGMGL